MTGELAVASDVPGAGNVFALHAAVPNPFNPLTKLSFTIPTDGNVQLVVYDIAGREVITLLDEVRTAGTHTVQWNGQDRQGNQAASGVYLYRLRTGDGVEFRRMTLLK